MPWSNLRGTSARTLLKQGIRVLTMLAVTAAGIYVWLGAQHLFVVIAHRLLRLPVRPVDTVMAGATAMAADTAAPRTRHIHRPDRAVATGGAVGEPRAAVPDQVGHAPAPPSRTHRRRCNPSRQSAKPLRRWLFSSPICATASCATHGLTGRAQPRNLTTRSRRRASKRGSANWTLASGCR